jgi:lysyl-tRNA synthetase class 2
LVFNYPVQLSPLAKPLTDNPAYTERWEAFLGGMELANSFSELNDPRVQLERFKEQRDSGDVEAQPYDENFIQALEQGMPPAGGVGIGVDRLVMILCGVDTIRDVVLFPALKPEVSQPNL